MGKLSPELRGFLEETSTQKATATSTKRIADEAFDKSFTGKAKKVGGRVLGGALKIIDQIERPYHALANLGVDIADGGNFNPLRSMKRGLTLQDKGEFSDITSAAGWNPESKLGKAAKWGVDFAGGVLLDPTTYLTAGFGKGALVLGRGMKPLSTKGVVIFNKQMAKRLGVKVGSKGFKKAVQKAPQEVYEKAIKATLKIAQKSPEKYFAKRAVRFAGKEVKALNIANKPMGKVMSAIKNKPLTRRAIKGKKAKLLGEVFDPYYKIKNSKNLSEIEKFEVLTKSTAYRNAREVATNKNIADIGRKFKKFTKSEREQVTFKLENFISNLSEYDVGLKGIKNSADELVKSGATKGIKESPDGLIQAGKYAEALAVAKNFEATGGANVVDNVITKIKKAVSDQTLNVQASAASLDDIADPRVRNMVESIQGELKDVWDNEVKLGIRDPESVIDNGYVKRILKGIDPKDQATGSKIARKASAADDIVDQTVEQSIDAYKKGDQDFFFEADSAKWLAARKTESDMLALKKENIDWLSSNGYLKKIGKEVDGKKLKDLGMESLEFNKQKYAAFPEIAKEFNLVADKLTDESVGKFWKIYDEALNVWKTSVTSPFPSFHARNFMSNQYLMYLGGFKNPKLLGTSFKIQRYGKQLRKGGKAVDKSIKLGDDTWKLSELYELAVKNDVLGSGFSGRDFLNKVRINPKLKEFGSRPLGATGEFLDSGVASTRKFGTAVENNARVSLFIDQLAKGKPTNEAAIHVKKFLFDYGELTEIERKVLKRAIPFYTFMRKNVPLQFEQMMTQPGKYTGVFHAKGATEGLSEGRNEEYLPDYLRNEEMTVRLPGQNYLRPDLPFQDLASIFSLDRHISSSSPLFKSLYEFVANKDLFTGKALADKNLPAGIQGRERLFQLAKNQIRLTSQWKKATNEEQEGWRRAMSIVLGISITKFDESKSVKFGKQREKRERSAVLRFQKTKDKKKSEEDEFDKRFKK